MMEDRGEDATWENSKVRFLEEYFPNSVRYAKEIEFMQLEQENISVTEYATRFKHLARFYTQTMTEAWRCRKFEFDLKQELKEVVIPMSIRDFPALVEKAKVVESLKLARCLNLVAYSLTKRFPCFSCMNSFLFFFAYMTLSGKYSSKNHTLKLSQVTISSLSSIICFIPIHQNSTSSISI